MARILFQDVAKSFPRHAGRPLLRGFLAGLARPAETGVFHALRDVSFEARDGEGLAIVGSNGAGKSTLLGLVAQVASPDHGRVEVDGRVAPLLELGSGFHFDLTGRENVELNAAMLGLDRRQVAARLDAIVEFSGVREFIDEPVRTWSSGMCTRLAFAVAVEVDPDILLVDEVLAVGDAAFQAKCLERIRRFREGGGLLLAVSHAAVTVRGSCERALWLDHGRLVMDGPIDDVLAAYEGAVG